MRRNRRGGDNSPQQQIQGMPTLHCGEHQAMRSRCDKIWQDGGGTVDVSNCKSWKFEKTQNCIAAESSGYAQFTVLEQLLLPGPTLEPPNRNPWDPETNLQALSIVDGKHQGEMIYAVRETWEWPWEPNVPRASKLISTFFFVAGARMCPLLDRFPLKISNI